MKLSAVLATLNEEENIGRCLNSVKDFADEIIVVDGSSEDKTREIAKSFGAKVLKVENLPMFHTNKQKAIDAAEGEWILQLDADEVVDKVLAEEIKKIKVTGSKYQAFAIKRKNYFLGKWLKKGGQYPDPVIRLFKKGKAWLPQISVHEQMQVAGKVATLNGHLIHHTAPTVNRYFRNANRYTTQTAEAMFEEKLKTGLFNTIKYFCIKPCFTFVLIYVRHKGFVDGLPGFLFALFSGLHWPLAYMKYWERLNLDSKSNGKL